MLLQWVSRHNLSFDPLDFLPATDSVDNMRKFRRLLIRHLARASSSSEADVEAELATIGDPVTGFDAFLELTAGGFAAIGVTKGRGVSLEDMAAGAGVGIEEMAATVGGLVRPSDKASAALKALGIEFGNPYTETEPGAEVFNAAEQGVWEPPPRRWWLIFDRESECYMTTDGDLVPWSVNDEVQLLVSRGEVNDALDALDMTAVELRHGPVDLQAVEEPRWR